MIERTPQITALLEAAQRCVDDLEGKQPLPFDDQEKIPGLDSAKMLEFFSRQLVRKLRAQMK